MKKEEVLSNKSKITIRDQVIAWLICTILYVIFSWIAPQIKIVVDLATFVVFSVILYFLLGTQTIKRFFDNYKFTESSLIQRIVGGVFWLAVGSLIIDNQMTGKVDASTSPIITYGSGTLLALVGFLQVFGRYELAKEAVNAVIYGEKYRAQNKWEQVLLESAEDLNEEYREELMAKATAKLEKLRKDGKIDAILFKQIQEIIEEEEKLSYEEFSNKYFDDLNK